MSCWRRCWTGWASPNREATFRSPRLAQERHFEELAEIGRSGRHLTEEEWAELIRRRHPHWADGLADRRISEGV